LLLLVVVMAVVGCRGKSKSTEDKDDSAPSSRPALVVLPKSAEKTPPQRAKESVAATKKDRDSSDIERLLHEAAEKSKRESNQREFDLLPSDVQKLVIATEAKLKKRPVVSLTIEERKVVTEYPSLLMPAFADHMVALFIAKGGVVFYTNMGQNLIEDGKVAYNDTLRTVALQFALLTDEEREVAVRISQKYKDAGQRFSTLTEEEKRFANENVLLFLR